MRIPIQCPNCSAVLEYNQTNPNANRKRKKCHCGRYIEIKTPVILPRETLQRIPSATEREEDQLRMLFEHQRSICIRDIRRIFPNWSDSKMYRFKDICLHKRIIREAFRSGRQIFWERCTDEIYEEPNPRALRLHNLRIKFPLIMNVDGFMTGRVRRMRNWNAYYLDQERWTVEITPRAITYRSKDHYYCENHRQIQSLEHQLANRIISDQLEYFENFGFQIDYEYTIRDEIGDNRLQSELASRNYRVNAGGEEVFDESPGAGSRETDYNLNDRIREIQAPDRIDELEERVSVIESELNQHTNILDSTTNSLERLTERTAEIQILSTEIDGLKRISDNLRLICSNITQAIGINRWTG